MTKRWSPVTPMPQEHIGAHSWQGCGCPGPRLQSAAAQVDHWCTNVHHTLPFPTLPDQTIPFPTRPDHSIPFRSIPYHTMIHARLHAAVHAHGKINITTNLNSDIPEHPFCFAVLGLFYNSTVEIHCFKVLPNIAKEMQFMHCKNIHFQQCTNCNSIVKKSCLFRRTLPLWLPFFCSEA